MIWLAYRQLWSIEGHHFMCINHNITWFYLRLTLKANSRLSPATTSSITVLFFTSRQGNMSEMSVWLQLNMPSEINCFLELLLGILYEIHVIYLKNFNLSCKPTSDRVISVTMQVREALFSFVGQKCWYTKISAPHSLSLCQEWFTPRNLELSAWRR